MTLTLLKNTLRDTGIIDAVSSVCADETECYLVGGAIRDCLVGRELNDFDFCFPDDPTEYASRIATALGATFFVLDAERGHSRLVLKKDEMKLSCDFAPFRAPSLESDLRKRDFTINAMAINCKRGDLELIDPLNGHADLLDGKLRVCSEYSFQDDPLRCLKGIRHAVNLGLEITPGTMSSLIDAAPQIDQVASERIRTELSRTVASEQPVKAFELLALSGLQKELFGVSGPDAFAAALVYLRDLDNVIKGLRTGTCGQIVVDVLMDFCEEDVSVETALRLAVFFYGYRPVALKSVLHALRFSKRTISLIEQIQGMNIDTVATLQKVADKPRSRARWLAKLGREPVASAIFLPLITTGTLQEKLLKTELLIDSFNSCSVQGKLPELVDGGWLTEQMGIAEGPVIGHIQALVHDAEVSGEATTVDEARQWVLANKNSIDNNFG